MRGTRSGFTMIELLVVMLIIGVLAAVAAPMYLIHVEKAKASEAVGVMSLVRQAEREYFTVHNTFLALASGNLENDPGAATNKGLGVKLGPAQYFSVACYTVATSGNFADGTAAADFLITVDGSASVALAGNVGARNNADVNTYRLQMDNSGRVVYSVDGGTTWKAYTG
jgi:prepilin-type N-terminal cleavage/methylation domain-containing protein